MKILAIETSCDETAIAIVEIKKSGKSDVFKILANSFNSQVKIHAEYGGVFPALAKREHQKNLPILFEKITKQAKPARPHEGSASLPYGSRQGAGGIKIEQTDAIAVTTGPGLEPALWTGIVFAKELSKKYNIPIIPVNHMEGHIFSIFPKKGKTFTIDSNKKIFPMLSLLVSGGHTELVLVKNWPSSLAGEHTYKKIGQTRDDAVGEAFDKVARMLGLPYPGGPEISRLASIERESGGEMFDFSWSGTSSSLIRGPEKLNISPKQLDHENSNASLARTNKISSDISLPRPMIYSKDYDFSFSGLKTAVLYLIRDLKKEHFDILENVGMKQKIAKEFEDAVVETLVYKTIKAIKEYKIKTLIVGGGVSANSYLQKVMIEKIKENKLKIKVHFPSKSLTGDNALMIAIAGYFQYKNKKITKNINSIKAQGNLSL